MKKLVVALVLAACLIGVGSLFWYQEAQYVLPTPVPIAYQVKSINQSIGFPLAFSFPANQALYLHFFNPDCPCSRFNLKHFQSLTNQFHKTVHVYAVIPAYADLARAREMIDDERVIVLQDSDDQLAEACGVYSTPQAVVINASHKLYYRGNYNRTRYCTLKESNYAEIALTALVNKQPPPVFNAFATQSYGCTLPSDQLLKF